MKVAAFYGIGGLMKDIMIAILAVAIPCGAARAEPDRSKPLYIEKGALVCMSVEDLDLVTKLRAIGIESPDTPLPKDCRLSAGDLPGTYINSIGAGWLTYWKLHVVFRSGPQGDVWVSALQLHNLSNTNQVAENYLEARARLLASGFAPAAVPRGGEFDQCGDSGENALCKRFPELVNCVGMGPSSGSCRMAFVAPDGRFFVVAAFGWENPNTMVITDSGWANSEDMLHINNILAGKPEFFDLDTVAPENANPENKSNLPRPTEHNGAEHSGDRWISKAIGMMISEIKINYHLSVNECSDVICSFGRNRTPQPLCPKIAACDNLALHISGNAVVGYSATFSAHDWNSALDAAASELGAPKKETIEPKGLIKMRNEYWTWKMPGDLLLTFTVTSGLNAYGTPLDIHEIMLAPDH